VKRFSISSYHNESAKAPITQKVPLALHIPSFSFKQQTHRPQTTKSFNPSEADFLKSPFSNHCSKYPRVKNLVNMKKQAPRKELAAPGLPLEYDPHYNLVFPRVMSARIGTRSKID